MKKFLIFIIMLSIVIPAASAEVTILNDKKYVGDDDSVHIVGEIQNNLDVPLRQIQVFVTLYDSNNNIISTKETSSLVNIIMPTMKSPFDLVLTERNLKQVESYELDFDYKVSAPKSQVIDITSSEITRDNHNNLMITGTVANNGETTANMVSVVATLYDKDGNVAVVSKTQPEPDYLRSDDEAFFLVSVPDKSQTTGVQEYSLLAESEEYAAVPEFPIGSMVLLAGSVSAYIGVTRYSGRIIANLVSATNPK